MSTTTGQNKSKTNARARREPPYFTLKVGGLTVLLKNRPKLLPVLLTGIGAAAGTACSLVVRARYGG